MNGTGLATILQKQTPSLPILIISVYHEATQGRDMQIPTLSVILKPEAFFKLNKEIHKTHKEKTKFFS